MKSLLTLINETKMHPMDVITKYLDAYIVGTDGHPEKTTDPTTHKTKLKYRYTVTCKRKSDIKDICDNIEKAYNEYGQEIPDSNYFKRLREMHEKAWDDNPMAPRDKRAYIDFYFDKEK